MHEAALRFVQQIVGSHGPFRRVLEVGSHNVNGSIRPLFDADRYVGIDLRAGDGVDLVADAATYVPDPVFDCAVSCEVFEHTPWWPQIIENMAAGLIDGGVLIVTCAGPDRLPHSGHDGGPVRPGEWYQNVEAYELAEALEKTGRFDFMDVNTVDTDLQAVAVAG